MAPKADIIRYSPTPAFTARMLALPAFNEAVDKALDALEGGKTQNNAVGAALRAAEASMRVAATGALPLATPFVNTVGGWGVVDEWACRGLDQMEKVAPIIKKPPREIVTKTRETMLKAVSGGSKVPDSFSDAITTRANQAAEFVAKTRGGVAFMNAADQMLSSAHTLVDNYFPPQRGDKQGSGIPSGGISIKVSSLFNKTQQRLYRSAYVLIRPPNDSSLDGTITIAMLVDFGRRTAEDLYEEISREPREGETQSSGMAMARMTFKQTKKFNEQLAELLKKQMGNMKNLDKDAITQLLQDTIKTSMEISSNTSVYVQGGINALIKAIRSVLQDAGTYRQQFEEMLRKAMADYENKERAARAAQGAKNFRQKNQMERVVSPTREAREGVKSKHSRQ